jgi:hypothetical protein
MPRANAVFPIDGRLQAREDLVEIRVPGGQPGDGVTLVVEALQVVEAVAQQVAQRGHGIHDPPLGYVEHQALGAVEDVGDVLGDAVTELGDLPGHRHQAPQQSVLLDDPCVVVGVADGRGVGLERDEDRGIADGLEQPPTAEFLGDRHPVGGLPLAEQRRDGREDVSVGRLVEVLRPADLHGRGDGVPGQEHGTEQRLLGFEIVGRYATGWPGAALVGGQESAGPRVVKRLNHGPSTLSELPCGA